MNECLMASYLALDQPLFFLPSRSPRMLQKDREAMMKSTVTGFSDNLHTHLACFMDLSILSSILEVVSEVSILFFFFNVEESLTKNWLLPSVRSAGGRATC